MMRVLLLLFLLVLPLFARHYDSYIKHKEDYDDIWMDVRVGSDREMDLMVQQIHRNMELKKELGTNITADVYDDSWLSSNVVQTEMDADTDLTKRSEEDQVTILNGAVSQNSVGSGGNPERAVDGNTDGSYWSNSCTHSAGASNNWWRMDFSGNHAISKVVIHNRKDCCQDRINKARVYVGDEYCGEVTYQEGQSIYEIDCDGAVGGSVTVVQDQNVLTLCEVQVYEEPETDCGRAAESLAEQIMEAVTGKDLGQVKSYLNSTEGSLAVFKHDLLSRMFGVGHCIDEHDEVYQWIMSNKLALETFMTSGDIPDNKLATSLEILKNLILEDPDIKTSPLYLRLAVATAVTHSTPVKYLYNPYKTIEPIQRYLDFKEWSLTPDYLFDVFFNVSAWHLRYVVGSWQSKEELDWARENTAEGYATPETIGSAGYQVMEYKLENSDGISVHKGHAYYYYYPQTLETMVTVGGVCGAISRVGAGFSNAYGVPSVPVGQPGHCAFIVYQNDRWVLHNDVFGWDSSSTHDGIQYSWLRPSNYFKIMDLAQKNPASYRLSEKMRLASHLAAPEDRFLIIEDATTVNPYNFPVWVEMKEAISEPDLDKGSVVEALLPTLKEFRAKEGEAGDLAQEKTVTSECFGDTSSKMVDIGGSEAFCADESGDFEIDLVKLSLVNEIRIQWWGYSKAAKYDIYGKNEFEEGSQYVKLLDQSHERVEGWCNHWSYIEQIENMVVTKLKFELKNGVLDPWYHKYYFGIRHLQIIGISSFPIVDVTKEMRTASTALIDEDPTTTWYCYNENFEVELPGICEMDTLQFNWIYEGPKSLTLTYSVGDSNLGTRQGTGPFKNVSIRDFASSMKVDISERRYLKGIAGRGTCYGAKFILKQKIGLFYQDHTLVETYIKDSISEFDYED